MADVEGLEVVERTLGVDGVLLFHIRHRQREKAAEALGREADVGQIAPGRYADIIAVDGDPLTDVRQLEDVDAVVKGGVLVKGN